MPVPVDQLPLDGVVELLQRRTRPCCPGSQGILGAGVLIGVLVVVISGVLEGAPVHAGRATPRRWEPAEAADGSVRGRQAPVSWPSISKNCRSCLCDLGSNKGFVHAKWMDMGRASSSFTAWRAARISGRGLVGRAGCGTGQAAVLDLPRHPHPPQHPVLDACARGGTLDMHCCVQKCSHAAQCSPDPKTDSCLRCSRAPR